MEWAKKIDTVAKEYFQYISRNENTSEYSIRSVYSNHIFPLLGNKKIKNIKLQDMRKLQDDMINKRFKGRKYSNKTINNVTRVFNIIMNYAVQHEYIDNNPCSNYTSLRLIKDYDKAEFWTDDQFIKAIEYEADYMWYCYLTISYLTGMRKGEMRGLKWKDIDFDKDLIHIRRHINDKRIHKPDEEINKEWLISGRKNGDEHILLLDSNTRKLLKELLSQTKECYNNYENQFIFGGNHPVGSNSPKRHLDALATKACLPRIKVHGLRHSHVSFLINKGLNAYEIAERIGDTVEMVLKVYGHMFPNPQANIVRELNANFDFIFKK